MNPLRGLTRDPGRSNSCPSKLFQSGLRVLIKNLFSQNILKTFILSFFKKGEKKEKKKKACSIYFFKFKLQFNKVCKTLSHIHREERVTNLSWCDENCPCGSPRQELLLGATRSGSDTEPPPPVRLRFGFIRPNQGVNQAVIRAGVSATRRDATGGATLVSAPPPGAAIAMAPRPAPPHTGRQRSGVPG